MNNPNSISGLRSKKWFILWLICFAGALALPTVPAVTPAYFANVPHLLLTAYAIIVVLILPASAFARLLNRYGDYKPFEALSLGIAFSIGLVSVTSYWLGRLTGFNPQAVALQILFASLAIFAISWPKAKTNPQPEKYFKNRRQILTLCSLLILFLLLVWIPFSRTGQITDHGVIVPRIGDWFVIYSDITSIVVTGIPPKNPFVASIGLIYYYLFHLYAAVFVVVSNGAVDIQNSGALTTAISAGACFLSFFVITKRWLKSFGAAIFGTSLITVVSAFDIIPTLFLRFTEGSWPPNIDHWTNWTRFRIMSSLSIYHWLPQHALGALFFFLIVFLLSRKFKTWLDRFLGVLSWACLFGFSSFAAFGGACIIIFYFLVDGAWLIVRRNRIGEFRAFTIFTLQSALIGALGLLLVSPIYWKSFYYGIVSYAGTSIIREFRLPPLNTVIWMPNYNPPNFVIHILGLVVVELLELGPLLIFGILGIILVKRWKEQTPKRILLASTIGSFIWVNTINMGGNNPGENSSKVVGILLIWLLAVWAGLFYRERVSFLEKFSNLTLSLFPTKASLDRFFAPIGRPLLVIIIIIGLATTLLGVAFLANWLFLTTDEFEAYLYIRNETPSSSLIQRGPCYDQIERTLPPYTWRLTPYAYDFPAREYLVDERLVQEMKAELDKAFKSNNASYANEVFKKFGAEYIFIGVPEKKRYGKALNKLDDTHSKFKRIWRRGEVTIYKVL